MIPVVLVAAVLGLEGPGPGWVSQASGTAARLRGVGAVGGGVGWASGTGGTVARTVDGGRTWTSGVVAGAEGLDFRDVEGFGGEEAVVLAAGAGGASRIYRTGDGGETWTLVFTNPDANGFLDAIAFFDARRGLAFGDPVGGRFVIFRTEDGGRTWGRNDPGGMPPAMEKEGAFAASGTCLVARGDKHAWFATGGARVSRVFRSVDGGRTWEASEVPVKAGNASSGVFSLAFADERRGLAIGGDYQEPGRAGSALAGTEDGGKTWRLVEPGPRGYRSGLAFVPGSGGKRVLAVGPGGADASEDGGRTWRGVEGPGFHAVSLGGRGEGVLGWGVGDDGRVMGLMWGGR